MTSAFEAEVTFLSAVNADMRVASNSFGTWFDASRGLATSDIYTWNAQGRPGFGATIKYWFDATWSSDEKAAFRGAMGLWSAIADVTFSEEGTAGAADFRIIRALGTEAADWQEKPYTHATVGAALLPVMTASPNNRIAIDTDDESFGPIGTNLAGNLYPMSTVIHELGHTLGLGHGGPYNGGNAPPLAQQFTEYDSRLWTLMSYINPDLRGAAFFNSYTVTDTSWNGSFPTTPMIVDIQAIQRLYGVQKEGPLSKGGQVFGFNSNIEGAISMFFDFNRNVHPVVTLWDGGTGNTLDLSGFHQDALIDLHPGTFSSAGGLRNNIGIAFKTVIETGIGGSGDDVIQASDVASTLKGNAGEDFLFGGLGNDELSGGPGADTYDGGGGLNVVRDRLDDLNGDRIIEFGLSTTIDVKDALVGRQQVQVILTPEGDTTLRIGNTSIDLDGRFEGGEFFVVARNVGTGPHTEVTFEAHLPPLAEGVAVNPAAINGVASQLFMTGDGSVSFRATLQAAISAFANSLGWYKVASDGTIGEAHLLFANTRAPGSTTIDLGAPGNGEKIAFFVIQDGFDRYGALPDNLTFTQADGRTPANANTVGTPILHSATLGNLGAPVFHTVAGLNPGQANQVLSGAAPNATDLMLGFEDTASASADNDFQDIVLALHTNRNDVYYLL